MQSLSRTQSLRELSDHALLKQYVHQRAQEPAAELVRRYSGLVYATCRRILGDEAAAEDAAQATFLVLMRKAGNLRPQANLATWLYFTAQHSARAIRRADARRIRREREAAEMGQQANGNTGESAISGEIDAALALLPAPQREAVVLRYLHGLSLQEAARTLNCPQETLHTRVNRALQRLRETLARRGAVVSSAALIACLSQEAGVTAPAAVTQTIVNACAGTVPASSAALAAANAVLQIMLLAKLKIAVLLCVAGLAIAAPAGLAIHKATQEPASIVPLPPTAQTPVEPVALPSPSKAPMQLPADAKVLFQEDFSQSCAGWEGLPGKDGANAWLGLEPMDEGYPPWQFFLRARSPRAEVGWAATAGTYLRFSYLATNLGDKQGLKLQAKRTDGMNYGAFLKPLKSDAWTTVTLKLRDLPWVNDPQKPMLAGEVLHQLVWLVYSEAKVPAGATLAIDNVIVFESAEDVPVTKLTAKFW